MRGGLGALVAVFLSADLGIIESETAPVTWGGYSQIRAELELLGAAVKKHYSYYHLVSGHDLPLKQTGTIHSYFEDCGGKQFVNFRPCDAGVLDRIRYYHLFQEMRGRNYTGIWQSLSDKTLKWQKSIGVDRLSTSNNTIYYGANWFSITHELAEYVLARRSDIKRRYSYSVCADEVFLQTIVMNSGIDWRLSAPHTEYDLISCMRFVDWTRGQPYTYRKEDFDLLMSSDYMFARKFDLEVDSEICSMIYNTLKGVVTKPLDRISTEG